MNITPEHMIKLHNYAKEYATRLRPTRRAAEHEQLHEGMRPGDHFYHVHGNDNSVGARRLRLLINVDVDIKSGEAYPTHELNEWLAWHLLCARRAPTSDTTMAVDTSNMTVTDVYIMRTDVRPEEGV